ncbi:MAG: copper amine oxidase [Firmicutes bacterium]|nr:copper amine oxidase [Bacillota bacterium]
MMKVNGRKLLLVSMAALLLLNLLAAPALPVPEIAGVIVQDRMLIPLRAVSESLGAQVVWNGTDKDIEIRTGERTVELRLNSERARVNGREIALDSPARLMGDKTYVPLRFVSEALGARVEWNQNDRSASVILGGVGIRVTSGGGEIRHYTYGSADVVEIPYGSAYRAVMALGQDQVGSTESLESMAGRHGAAAAINGTFFEAYNQGDYKPPTGWSLIRNRRLVTFGGNHHTMFGFTDDGRVKVAFPEVMIWGGTNGSYSGGNWWDAANVNGMPIPESNRIAVFTREYGATLGPEAGTMVVVTHGRVTQITRNQAVAIPDDGFVILDQRSDPRFLGRFQIGTAVSYKPELRENGMELDWSDVVTGIEMGPTLVRDGAIVVDPVSEGFDEANILSASGQRSALGVKANGDVILLVSPDLTIWQLAQVMSELGVWEAINLDGGASSGLYLNGKYIKQPGRELSNALLFVPK